MLGRKSRREEHPTPLLPLAVEDLDAGRFIRGPLQDGLVHVHEHRLRLGHPGRRGQIRFGQGGEAQHRTGDGRIAGKVGGPHLEGIGGAGLQTGQIDAVLLGVLGIAGGQGQRADAEVHEAVTRLVRPPLDDGRVRGPGGEGGPLDDDRRGRIVVLLGGEFQGPGKIFGPLHRHDLGPSPGRAEFQDIAGRVPTGEAEQVPGPRLEMTDPDLVVDHSLGFVHHFFLRGIQTPGSAVGQPRNAALVRDKGNHRPLVADENDRPARDHRRLAILFPAGAEDQIPAPRSIPRRVRGGNIAGQVRGIDPVVVFGPRTQIGERDLVLPGQGPVAHPVAVVRILPEVHEAVGRLIGAPDNGHLVGFQVAQPGPGDDGRRLAILLRQGLEGTILADGRPVAGPVPGQNLEVVDLVRLQPGQADPVLRDEIFLEQTLAVVEVRPEVHLRAGGFAGAPGDRCRAVRNPDCLGSPGDEGRQGVGRGPGAKGEIVAFRLVLGRVRGRGLEMIERASR